LADQQIRLFISHSSQDRDLAERLIDLIRAALNLPASAIRCTSVDGYRLPGGATTDDQLRREVHDSDTFIGIVSAEGVRSPYVLFELGARWGAGKHLVPLLAPGSPASVLAGPLAGLNALRCDSRAQLHQLVEELASPLSVPLQSRAAFEKYVDRVVTSPASGPAGASVEAHAAERPGALGLSPDHLCALQFLAEAGDEGLTAEDLAERMKVTHQKAQHYIGGLLDGDYISTYEVVDEPTVYLLEVNPDYSRRLRLRS
jgi:hypothetical protein